MTKGWNYIDKVLFKYYYSYFYDSRIILPTYYNFKDEIVNFVKKKLFWLTFILMEIIKKEKEDIFRFVFILFSLFSFLFFSFIFFVIIILIITIRMKTQIYFSFINVFFNNLIIKSNFFIYNLNKDKLCITNY